MHHHGEHIHATPEEFQVAVIRALTNVPPASEEETVIHHFIARWPEYTGGWLLMHCGLLSRCLTDAGDVNASLSIRVDRHASWMSVDVKGLKPVPLPGFNDWFIHRQQFICFAFMKNDADADTH